MRAVADDGTVASFSNYTSNTVDIAFQHSNGSTITVLNVAVDGSRLSQLRSYHQSGWTKAAAKRLAHKEEQHEQAGNALPLSLEQMFDIAGVSTGIFLCAGGIAGAFVTAGASLAILCGTTVLSALALFSGNQVLENASTAIDVVQCIQPHDPDCVGFGIEIASTAIVNALESTDVNSEPDLSTESPDIPNSPCDGNPSFQGILSQQSALSPTQSLVFIGVSLESTYAGASHGNNRFEFRLSDYPDVRFGNVAPFPGPLHPVTTELITIDASIQAENPTLVEYSSPGGGGIPIVFDTVGVDVDRWVRVEYRFLASGGIETAWRSCEVFVRRR